MTVNGLWTIIFTVNGRPTSMVATISGGKITGGNSVYFYSGELTQSDEAIHGKMIGQHYFDVPDPLFGGAKNIPLEFSAKIGQGIMQGTAKVNGIPGSIGFTGKKVS